MVRRLCMVAVIAALSTAAAWALPPGGNAASHGPSAAAGGEMRRGSPASAPVVSLQRAGERKAHEYRGIERALVAARDWQPGDLTLRAESAVSGQTVAWRRTNGTWSVSPASAVVLVMPKAEGQCLDKDVVLASVAELKAYQRSHSEAAGKRTLAASAIDRILSAGQGPLPKEAACPVTGEKVRPTASTDWTLYKGKTYYFCCAGCKPRFVADPAGYVSGKTAKLHPGQGESCGGHGDEACECPSQKGSSAQQGQHKAAPHHRSARHT